MTLDELNQIIAALMIAGNYALAAKVREYRDARETARNAILDHVHGVNE